MIREVSLVTNNTDLASITLICKDQFFVSLVERCMSGF